MRAQIFRRLADRARRLAVLLLLVWPAQGAELELLHLWRTESERQALAVLQQAIMGEGLVWREHAVDGNFGGVRARFAERVALGHAPSASFWIGGNDLRKFVDDGLFRVVRDTPGRPKLGDLLLPEVRDMVARGGDYTALPLGIHLQNIVVYNRSIFDQLALKTPRSWQEFLNLAPTILQAGYTPLSLSDQPWQLRFLLTSILVEQMDHLELQGLLDPKASVSEAVKLKLRRALDLLGQLRPFVNADFHDLDWEKVALAVAADKAAAVVMGDFLAPMFSDDMRFECGLAPGNTFVLWSLDVVVFPRLDDESRTLAQDVAIRAWAQAGILDAYVARKGGISVLAKSSIDTLPACAQQSAIAFRSGVPRVPLVTQLWTNQLNRLSSIAGEFWNGGTRTPDEVADLILVALKSG